MARVVFLSAILLAITGRATTFYGSPNVANGPNGCKAKCSSWGMELSGMVAMGEHSDGCICHLPSAQQKAAGAEASAAGVSMAAVWSPMQEAERQRAANAARAQQR